MKLAQRIGISITLFCMLATAAFAQDRPNILVIFGDDIGWSNLGAYNHGVMGYQTPNIDQFGLSRFGVG